MFLHILVIVIEFQKLVSRQPHQVINFFIVVGLHQNAHILGHFGFHTHGGVLFLLLKVNWWRNLVECLTPYRNLRLKVRVKFSLLFKIRAFIYILKLLNPLLPDA